NLWRRAEAFAAEVIREAARAGIGGRDKNERSRESECHCGASYCDSSVFKRLPENLQNIAREFGKLIEEEHTVVRHAHFAGPGESGRRQPDRHRRSCGAVSGMAACR